MKKKIYMAFLLSLAMGFVTGCGESAKPSDTVQTDKNYIKPDKKIQSLEEGLSVVRFEGNYGFDGFLEQGGASSDNGVVEYLSSALMSNIPKLLMGQSPFGCSTLSVKHTEGGNLFGRNFDWNTCNALIVSARPEEGYASVSTVNTDFIQAGGLDISRLPDTAQAIIGLYTPLDGMNEEGLAVSVNMIEDSATIEQDTDKPDITTTTAIRLLLDKASDVEEALELLSQYDFHASMGMMVHLALSDAQGNSVAVEYIDNEMVVTETPVVTNFYLAEGVKYGVGTLQSHTRYDILNEALEGAEAMTEADVRDALDSVGKDNFGEFESTEWSIVMNQETKELTYYHRENYKHGYTILVE
ncbi:linear amide C-N hydrolase [Bariatricus massiliensis]|uniref:Linear amide C-N hydrolase n=1 Tax=Bariatricus massiliensis TaxID=1745713 RepID=A0ABS8DFE5_9FIRM|nr:C45 family peptidase [Bariatricus massiliensis]MCB7304016.1 linear amide C-N hydrolase [Bariatricus massiliensis]MCB7374553.1 linear amide C-N hydrolase [Bariatricus massiliensis]MCB7387126.1 linear amide C-N hydrolase [Bariatricus massiliensis]MCB7411288.1 linear amide C-N hydrolase [Bariatricus massiliensis]MCQ5252766.1 linear amide C-N hydrolase [Bariatricus massiliensis]